MHDIICPHCSKAFKVDEAGYADILKQVRDRDFEQQLAKRLALAEQEKRNAIDLAMARKQTELQELEAQLQPGRQAGTGGEGGREQCGEATGSSGQRTAADAGDQ